MNRRTFLAIGASAGVAACATEGTVTAAPLSSAEQASSIAKMRPPKRARPLVAVMAAPLGAETCDTLVPLAVLRRSGLVDARLVSRTLDTVPLMPVLRVRPEMTMEAFNTAWPDGADYVVVPAMHDARQQADLKWIQGQAARGATIIAICAGAIVVSNAGLIGDRRATTHWYRVAELRRANPGMVWVKDRRYVVDRGIVTTTGVSAAVPVSLALVEAICGAPKALDVAAAFGVANWDASHASDDFRLTADRILSIVGTRVTHPTNERLALPIRQGFDEAALALAADAYSNTGRSRVVAVSETPGWVRGASGIDIWAEAPRPRDTRIDALANGLATNVLEASFGDIADRYGRAVAADVALYLEYRRRGRWSQS